MNDEYGNAVELPGPWANLDEVHVANVGIGNHWFDAETMRWFGCRIETGLIAGRLFISSEQDDQGAWNGVRRYTVRVARDDGSVSTIGDFGAHPTYDEAVRKLSSLVGYEVTV